MDNKQNENSYINQPQIKNGNYDTEISKQNNVSASNNLNLNNGYISENQKSNNMYGGFQQNVQSYGYNQNANQTPYGYNQNVNQTPYGYNQNANQAPYGYNQNANQAPYGYSQNANQAPYGYNQNANQAPYGYNQNVNQAPYGYMSNYSELQNNAMKKDDVSAKTKKEIIIGVVFAILVLALGIVATIIAHIYSEDMGKRASDKVIETFFKEYNAQDFDGAYDTFHPDIREQIKQKVLDSFSITDEMQLWDIYCSYFGGFKVEYTINKSKKMSKDEIEEVLSDVNSSFDVQIEIEKAYVYELTETYSGINGEQVQIETVVVGKDDDKWYIVAASTDEIVSNSVGSNESDKLK